MLWRIRLKASGDKEKVMLSTNQKRLPKIAIQGEVTPSLPRHLVSYDGESIASVGMGGICYNVKVGDSAFGWAGDHLEPGVTVGIQEPLKEVEELKRFNLPACVGNKAVYKENGERYEGVVTGLHTGVLVDFPAKALEKISIEDDVLVQSYGQGLKLQDFPSINIINLDPKILHEIAGENGDGLEVEVVNKVPSKLMGSGLGKSPSSWMSDYDMMTSDEELIEETGLKELKIGDLVAIEDQFAHYGPCYQRGSITIGVVVHGDSKIAGHGPGILPILTTKEEQKLKLKSKENANIGRYLKCGRYRN